MHPFEISYLENTNIRIRQYRSQKTIIQSWMGETDTDELRAFLGLLYYRGLLGLTKHSTRHLWGREGPVVFSATMSQNRFTFLNSKVSFDDKSTREERWKNDREEFNNHFLTVF